MEEITEEIFIDIIQKLKENQPHRSNNQKKAHRVYLIIGRLLNKYKDTNWIIEPEKKDNYKIDLKEYCEKANIKFKTMNRVTFYIWSKNFKIENIKRLKNGHPDPLTIAEVINLSQLKNNDNLKNIKSSKSKDIKSLEKINNEQSICNDFEKTSCSIIHNKKFDTLNISMLNDKQFEEIDTILSDYISSNKNIINEIRLSTKFGNDGAVSELILYKRGK